MRRASRPNFVLLVALMVIAGCSGGGRSAGYIAGTIRELGGPAPGINRGIRGTVLMVDTSGRERTARTSSAGGFLVSLPSGSYRVSAKSPEINSGRDSCSQETKVRVANGKTTRFDLICNIK